MSHLWRTPKPIASGESMMKPKPGIVWKTSIGSRRLVIIVLAAAEELCDPEPGVETLNLNWLLGDHGLGFTSHTCQPLWLRATC